MQNADMIIVEFARERGKRRNREGRAALGEAAGEEAVVGAQLQ